MRTDFGDFVRRVIVNGHLVDVRATVRFRTAQFDSERSPSLEGLRFDRIHSHVAAIILIRETNLVAAPESVGSQQLQCRRILTVRRSDANDDMPIAPIGH